MFVAVYGSGYVVESSIIIVVACFEGGKGGRMSDYARIGSLAHRYAWIAMYHYGKAKKDAEVILSAECYSDTIEILERNVENNMLIGVNFSAMALESFFNDYAAYKLGDNFYHDNFEMLRPIAKFQMIMKFILQQDILKGELVYQLIDSLFKIRNGYVHNKSKDAHGKGMSEEEHLNTDYYSISMEDEEKHLLKYSQENVRKNIKEVSNAVKAVVETAKKVDELDEDSSALTIFLLSRMVGLYDKEELEIVQEVQREFHIPESMDCREL